MTVASWVTWSKRAWLSLGAFLRTLSRRWSTCWPAAVGGLPCAVWILLTCMAAMNVSLHNTQRLPHGDVGWAGLGLT